MERKEFDIFEKFIADKGLRSTSQRRKVLELFLLTEKHVSAQELHKLSRRRHSDIGFTTVYRTMKLLSQSGLCQEIDLGDGVIRFEHKYGHQHHDHLICTKCGSFIEVNNPEIEKLQEAMAKEHRFIPTRHLLEIFGICNNCAG